MMINKQTDMVNPKSPAGAGVYVMSGPVVCVSVCLQSCAALKPIVTTNICTSCS